MIILKLKGNIGVAAYGVIANLSLVMVAIFTGVSQGIQPILSNGYGYGNLLKVKKTLQYALISVLILSGIIYFGIYIQADAITSVFNSENNPDLQKMAVWGLKLYFTSTLFVGCNAVISVFFTSTEKPVPAQIISMARGLVLIVPMAFALSAMWGMTGVWLAFPVTEMAVLAAVGIVYLLRRNVKR